MALIPAKCTQCGANIEVDDTHEAGICQYCGTPFITEKVINNYSQTINIDNAVLNIQGADEQNLIKRARQYELDGDKEKALDYYNKVLDINIDNEEASLAVKRLTANDKKYIYSFKVSDEQASEIDNLLSQYEKVKAIKAVRDITGLGLKEAKDFIDTHNIGEWKHEPTDVTTNSTCDSQVSSGGCYVATCVYGSYDCPEVWTLRRFRDYTLDETWYGRLFIKCYYAISPTIVKWFGSTEWFKTFWKKRLDTLVANLRAKGVEDTEYTDKY